jgi:excisionase family DNA binding protein
MSEKLMQPKELAAITGFHPRTISDMGKRGEIPGAVLIGKHVRFDAKSVRDFLTRGGHLNRAAQRANSLGDAPAPLL